MDLDRDELRCLRLLLLEPAYEFADEPLRSLSGLKTRGFVDVRSGRDQHFHGRWRKSNVVSINAAGRAALAEAEGRDG